MESDEAATAKSLTNESLRSFITGVASTAIATRGERLALSRAQVLAHQTEGLSVAEFDVDGQIVTIVGLDVDDFDAAFEELDARYLAGEAAPYRNTWSVIVAAYAAFNRASSPRRPGTGSTSTTGAVPSPPAR